MQDIMEENLVRVSIIMNEIKNLTLLLFALFFIQCDEDFQEIPLPPADFPDVVINLTLPEFDDLRVDRGFIIIPDAGIRGIIVYRQSATEYTAFELNCSFESNSASANVEVDPSGFSLIDRSCTSRFNTDNGMPIAGPARSSLRIYESRLAGNTLTITDESANGQ